MRARENGPGLRAGSRIMNAETPLTLSTTLARSTIRLSPAYEY